MAELISSEIPVVTLDYVFENCSSVSSDNAKGMRKLIEYAHSMGHSKIALIHGEITEVTNERLSGFYRACREQNIKVPDEYIRQGRYHDIENCAIRTAELLNLPDPPTCIIFPDDYSYLGAKEIIAEYGLSIPDDISVIGYDGINTANIMRLTTYEQNAGTIGRKAAEKLIFNIENPDSDADHIEVTGRLLEGCTVKKLT